VWPIASSSGKAKRWTCCAISSPGERRRSTPFIDVDKARVAEYVDLTLSLLAPRGLVIVDNVLWHGWVLDDTKQDADTQGMRNFTRAVTRDARLEVAVVPIADGMSLIRRVEPSDGRR